jgi:amino acid adenylation domain-containing protein
MSAATQDILPGLGEIIARCRSAGVKLALANGQLRILPPAGGIDARLMAALRARKPEIIEALARALVATPRLSPPPLVRRADKGSRLPLAHGQENMWLGEQYARVADMSNLTVVIETTGSIEIAALEAALSSLAARHAPLRTLLPEDEAGKPFQRVLEHVSVPLVRADFSAAALRDAQLRRFDLKREPPFRALLLRRSAEAHALVLTLHHTASDGWSIGVLLRELGVHYEAACACRAAVLPPLAVDFGDYTLWQRDSETSEWFARGLDYWRARLHGAPATHDLPVDRTRGIEPSFETGRVSGRVDAVTLAALESCARQQGVTLFVLLLSAFGVLIHRLGGDDDIIVGVLIANRLHDELAPLIGLFRNMVGTRLRIRGDERFTEFLARVNTEYLADIEHQGIPIDRVGRETGLGAARIAQLSFVLQNNDLPEVRLAGVACRTEFHLPTSAAHDLHVSAWQTGQGLELDFQYASALFDRERIERMLQCFATLLHHLPRALDESVARLPLLTPAERAGLLALGNDTAVAYDAQSGFHHLFESWAARQPDKVAVRFGTTAIGYAALNERANRLARWLIANGAAPDVPIGICLERSPELVIALLAVGKSGAAYLPLDPTLPGARLRYMVAHSGARCVLATRGSAAALGDIGGRLVLLDEPDVALAIEAQSATNPTRAEQRHAAGNLCYVIYTSGSTGNPKGVMVEHRGLTNFLASMRRMPGIGADDAVLAITTPSFDIHTLEHFGALTSGATIVLAASEEFADPGDLVRLIDEHAVTIVQATPATWLGIFDTGWRPDRPLKALCGGEALPDSLRDKLLSLPRLELWNLYGPTETSVWSSVKRIEREVLIGTPIANTRFYVLDAQLEPVPPGVIGDLYIAGDGLARGYLCDPELTASAFLDAPPPYLGESRLYRTGDRVSRRANGELSFHGRRDHQVKVNGFRIETGEIVSALESLETVRQAAVVVRRHASGANQLAAFFVARGAPAPGADALAARLQQLLPRYMVPVTFVALEALPTTSSGKIDLKRLAAWPIEETNAPAGNTERQAPRDPVPRAFAEIWTDLLALAPDALALDDDLFAQGADSIRVMMFVGRARKRGLDITAAEVYRAPTLRGMAAIARAVDAQPAATPYSGPAPLLADQCAALADDRVWRRFYINFIFDLPRAIDLALLQRALQTLTLAHDALRARFTRSPAGIEQSISGEFALPMAFAESLGCGWQDAAMPAALRAAIDRVHARLSAERGPLLAAAEISGNDGSRKLLFVVSHLVADGFSTLILIEDLIDVYGAMRREQPPTLSDPLPIDAWAPRYREYVNSDAYCAQLAFWESLPWTRVRALPRDFAHEDERVVNLAASTRSFVVRADERTTQAIQWGIPQALGIAARDVLAIAIARVLMRASASDAVALHVNDAGRRDLEEALGLDFSRVVGAFALRNCLFFERAAGGDLLEEYAAMNEQIARTPHGGSGLLPLQTACERADVAMRARRIPDPEVWFNYFGTVAETLSNREAADAEIPTRPSDVMQHIDIVTHHADTPRQRVLMLVGRVSAGCLELLWEYSAALHREESVRRLADDVAAELARIVDRVSELGRAQRAR